jgi:Flp pilus assembly protein TadG
MLSRSVAGMPRRAQSRGQVLVLFVLFLLVLLGISALAIDYASWLLVDRNLQNVADHAALAGASAFDQRTSQGGCFGGSGQVKCEAARAQAWASINDELNLNLTAAQITQLSLSDSGANGTTTITAGGNTTTWQPRIWVATPPPTYAAYTTPSIGGRYASNYGVVFARVDRDVLSFIGGALGVQPQPRHGWATAGALPTDFALETFCRNNIAPQSGVCVNSAGVTIDGQGGIRLVRGDVGSNESLVVTANTGNGMVLQSGDMFLVNGTCGPSSWSCPNSPPQGGISDGVNGKNAFYMAPLPVPQFESPINGNTVSAYSCSGADATHLCVPRKDQGSANPSSPGDWSCSTSSNSPIRCGTPTVSSGAVTCSGAGGGNPPLHYYPVAVASGANNIAGDASHTQTNGNEYNNIDDDVTNGDPDAAATPANPPADWVYADNLNIGNSNSPVSTSFTVNLGQSGPRLTGNSTVTYAVFKTNDGVLDNSGYDVTVTVSLVGGVTSTQSDTTRTLTGTPTQYSFNVSSANITDYNSLQLQFTFNESGVNNNAVERGGGVSWAEIKHPDPQPAVPPFIAPGYYRSITIPDNGCAILDPTAEYSSLLAYQMPGIYRFGGSGSNSTKKIKVGDNAFLIGDGVTLVFDADWPDSGSNQGVAIGANGALVLNTMRVTANMPPCTPSEAETTNVNMSAPLSALPYSALCAAWAIDNSVTTGIKPGGNAWASCDPANLSNSHCVNRSSYNPPATYRGVTFYFTPSGWPPSGITNRFEMQGGSGNDAGLAFRGVMYAPYDDVKITGGNGFNTVGQVLAWTAKFNGGSASINLDYPYDFTPAAPYLLEPTVDH